ncbi:efflux transporter outer membrane subunit [Labrys monachus]|uniref:NodT family efflux transporter outer membrane factor (OMF) lipoprotein n=1 Tax=Labrys monachus TaxID=217067 RepID=A0ABU0FFM4_9HYPH|nr:efflux transporter outer membrane subunit [Labrys monachus]MDQ0393137.1 NodT family efflux transporter outer membrane factor (OMF) lipoprotein [Labrys monachus]
MQLPSDRRRHHRLWGGPAILLLLAGCADVRPLVTAVSVPAGYREGGSTKPAEPLRQDWWRSFRSPELSALIEQARIGNLDIATAIANIEQARANIVSAGAALYPQINGDASAQRSRQAGSDGHVGRGQNLFSLSASASYELDFWGKNSQALASARSAAAATQFDRDTVELTTIASVANAYFAILAAQDRLAIARDNVASASHIMTLIDNQFKAGTASGLDVAQQQSLLAQQKASIPPLELSIEENKSSIALLVGRPPALVKIGGGGMARIHPPRISAGLPSQLLTRRPDIAEARATLISSHQSALSAYAAQFPSISLTGQGGVESTALKSLFDPAAGFYSAAAGLTQPIFDGGTLRSAVEHANGVQDASLAAYRKAVVQAFVDVENALAGVRLLTRQQALQQDVVDSSRKAYDISEQQLRGGTVDLVTVLQTEQTLFSAQDSLAQIKLSRLQALISLHQALGGGWTAPAPLTPPD